MNDHEKFNGFSPQEFPYELTTLGNRRKPILYQETENGCWECVSHAKRKGYPVVFHEGRYWGIHQLSYTLSKGEILEGLVVRHKCDNRLCINPEHLETGTIADNNRDSVERGRNFIPNAEIGENNSNAVLTEKQVIEIKKRLLNYTRGLASELADEYGVSVSAIKGIKSGRRWGWLEVQEND